MCPQQFVLVCQYLLRSTFLIPFKKLVVDSVSDVITVLI